MREISGLPLFAKVVALESFAEAARQMGVPTTTVSRKIQLLEDELGGKLLNRTTRSLSLTELGERVLPKAQLIADTVTELQHDADQLSGEPIGTLTITAPRALSQSLIAPLLGEFLTRYPTIQVNLSTSNRFQDLTKSNIDFAFRLGPLSDSSLVALPLSEVKYVLCASPKLVNDIAELSRPEQLSQLPCIRNHVEGYFLPWQFNNGREQYEHQAAAHVICDDFLVSRQLALDGVGVSYLPHSLLKPHLDEGSLVSLLEAWIPQNRTMLLVYPDRRHLPLKSQLFVEFMKEKRQAFLNLLS
ncbi:LysR substrate-binding domain-containing protein [Corallincola platygyrae]|uniref:LysR substrate-binding domain-containing protein n=1 Tax=Corallincola platygyrae TaxID=1193278 RepID=A0ABW4XQS9_9GAMM